MKVANNASKPALSIICRSFGSVLCFKFTPMYIRLLCFCKLVYAVKFCNPNESLKLYVAVPVVMAQWQDR